MEEPTQSEVLKKMSSTIYESVSIAYRFGYLKALADYQHLFAKEDYERIVHGIKGMKFPADVTLENGVTAVN